MHNLQKSNKIHRIETEITEQSNTVRRHECLKIHHMHTQMSHHMHTQMSYQSAHTNLNSQHSNIATTIDHIVAHSIRTMVGTSASAAIRNHPFHRIIGRSVPLTV